ISGAAIPGRVPPLVPRAPIMPGAIPIPPPIPAATGAAPTTVAPAAAPVSTDTGDTLPPNMFAISGVCGELPPAPGSDAARTMPAPPLGPDPPASGWLDNEENGLAFSAPGPLPPTAPNSEVICCSG